MARQNPHDRPSRLLSCLLICFPAGFLLVSCFLISAPVSFLVSIISSRPLIPPCIHSFIVLPLPWIKFATFKLLFFRVFFSPLFSISITTHPSSYCTTSSHHNTRPDRLGSRSRCTYRNSCFAPEVLFSMSPRAKRAKCKVRFAVGSCGLGFKLT